MLRKAQTLTDFDRDLRAFNCMDRIPEIKVGKYSYSDIKFNTIDSDVVVFYSEALNKEVEKLKQENEQLKKQLENEKQLNAEIKKRLVEVEYDCEEFNHEYCDPNCNGKRKETIDLLQLISDGLNETLLKQKDEENKQLAKRICELQSDLSKVKSMNEKMKRCQNCVNETVLPYKEPCYSCHNRSEWRLAE